MSVGENDAVNLENVRIEVKTDFLYPGVILKGDAFTAEGEKVIDGFKAISAETIAFLKSKNIKVIYYTRPAPMTKNTCAANRVIPLEVLEKAFSVAEEIEVSILKKSPLPQKEIENTVEEIIKAIAMAEMDAVLDLLGLKSFDEYTYTHSVNVAMLAIMFAKKLLWDDEKIKQLGIGGMLHDIGKLLIPKEVLNKKGKLVSEEWEMMKNHAIFGYEILKNQSQYPEDVIQISLHHHENFDGKGYPEGLFGDKIDEMSSIITICDTFDAMTSVRPYKVALPQWFSFLFINNQRSQKFNPRLVASFVSIMPRVTCETDIIPAGTFVMLNTQEIARVIKTSAVNTFKPAVEILINSRNEQLKFPLSVDLANDSQRFIENIVDDNTVLQRLVKKK
jgi:putative nucleotidyltransferase with HDIG domain